MKWYIYIIRCSNGSYYVGHTNCVQKRLHRHVLKHGANHTAVYMPKQLEFTEEFNSEKEAVARELQIKKWSREKKKALINGDFEKLHNLSKSHD